MDEESKVTDVVVLKQLPIIEERLAVLHDEITEKVNAALSLECTEETVKEIKKVRANLKKESTDFETRRKDIKKKILEPYEQFESVYKKYIGDLYNSADRELAAKITQVENGLKQSRIDELMDYFEECVEASGLTFDDLSFMDLGVNVTLSASMKSLKDSVKSGVERIRNELAVIAQDPNSEEVLIEYRKTHNLSQALLTVSERHRQMEGLRRKAELNASERESDADHVAQIDEILQEAEAQKQDSDDNAFSAPVVESLDALETTTEDEYEVVFRVVGSIPEISALKKYLVENGYNYEQIELV